MSETRTLEVTVAAKSDPGLVRKENQDRMTRFYSPFGEVFLVTDGMGGHRGGARAAAMVEEGFTRHLRALPLDTPIDLAIRMAAEKTNAAVVRESRSGSPETASMGATLVVAILRGNDVVIGHVGDSRAYLYRAGQLQVLTRDHTRGQDKVEAGLMNEEEAWDDPDSSVLTRAFGHSDPLNIDISAPIQLKNGDQLLLCSDGLCGYVKDRTISSTLAQGFDAKRTVEKLIQLANNAGGEDNITAQVILVGGEKAAAVHGPTLVEEMEIPAAPSHDAGSTDKEGVPRSLRTILTWILAALLLGGATVYWSWSKLKHQTASEKPNSTGKSVQPEQKTATTAAVDATQSKRPGVVVVEVSDRLKKALEGQNAQVLPVTRDKFPNLRNAVVVASDDEQTRNLAYKIHEQLRKDFAATLIAIRPMDKAEEASLKKAVGSETEARIVISAGTAPVGGASVNPTPVETKTQTSTSTQHHAVKATHADRSQAGATSKPTKDSASTPK